MKTKSKIILSLTLLLSVPHGAEAFFGHAEVLTQRGGEASARVSSPLFSLGSLPFLGSERADIENKLLGMYDGGELFSWSVPTRFFPLRIFLKAKGRLGGSLCSTVSSRFHFNSGFTWTLKTQEGVLGGAAAEGISPDPTCSHPSLKRTLPLICPLMASSRLLAGDTAIEHGVLEDQRAETTDYYDAALAEDTINNPPNLKGSAQPGYDCNNVLRIEKVETRFDWEDADMVISVDPTTGQDVTEGNVFPGGVGGAYSNFHYAVVPSSSTLQQKYNDFLAGLPQAPTTYTPGFLARAASQLYRCADSSTCDPVKQKAFEAMQFLLDTGNAATAHSLLPGAFWTKTTTSEGGDAFQQCEWLDTRYQAPQQTMNYENFGIWDWDLHTNQLVRANPLSALNPCVGVILWEGDNGVSDDFIGYFHVCWNDTTGLILNQRVNYSQDLDIYFSTGSTECGS